MTNASRVSDVRSNAAYRRPVVAVSSADQLRSRVRMLNAVLDRLVSVLRAPSAGASQPRMPRIVAIAVLAVASWGVLALVVVAASWGLGLAGIGR